MRVEEKGVYEMLWDCAFCGTAKLLAKTHHFCPQCGAPQDTTARYFPETEADKIAVQNPQYVGADLICPACTAANAGNAGFCSQCGAPLNDANRAKTKVDEVFDAKGERVKPNTAAPKSRFSNRAVWLFAIGIGGLVLGIAVLFFWTEEKTVQVQQHSWTREIQIERLQPKSESQWCDSLPSDAYSVTRREEVRSYQQVADGETCSTRRVDQGDGTFKELRECVPKYRSEPIYAAKCYFTVNRWDYADSVKTGAADLKPYWGAAQLMRTGNCLGCEREGKRVENYYLHLQASDGKAYQCSVAQTLWQNAPVQSRWNMQVGAMLGEARCDSLKRAGS